MVDYVRKIVESDNDLAPRAENPAKLSYRVLRTRQKIKDESGPNNVKTRIGDIQLAQIALFERQVGEATMIPRIGDISWVEIDTITSQSGWVAAIRRAIAPDPLPASRTRARGRFGRWRK